MSRKQIKDTRRLQLIEANIACIARYGLADTTIAHVAQAASMSRGIVNFYFDSKEKMMQETLSQLITDYHQALGQAVRSEDPLKAAIDVHFSPRLCGAKRLAVWVAFVAHAASHTAYRRKLVTSSDYVTDTLASCLSPATPGDPDIRQQATELKAMIYGLWQQCLLSPDVAVRDSLAAGCLAFAGRNVARAAKPVRKDAEILPMLDLFAEKA